MTQMCPRCGRAVTKRVFFLRGYCSVPCYQADKNDGLRLGGDPTPEEIAEMTAAIRATWSEHEYRKRAFMTKHEHEEGNDCGESQHRTPPEMGHVPQRRKQNE